MVLLVLTAGILTAQQPTAQQVQVTPVLSKDLPEIPGKEVVMITVEYAPGGSDPIHRQTFYEGPDDVHVVGRNASSTKPAKFLVFLFKEKGAPILLPES